MRNYRNIYELHEDIKAHIGDAETNSEQIHNWAVYLLAFVTKSDYIKESAGQEISWLIHEILQEEAKVEIGLKADLAETKIGRYEEIVTKLCGVLKFEMPVTNEVLSWYNKRILSHITPPTQTTAQVEASATPNGIQTGEAGKRPETPSKLKRNRGRPQKEFDSFFITPDDATKVTPILEKLLKGKFGRDATRIIVACCHGGWITEPTPASIERRFGIEASGLKEHLRCHFRPNDENSTLIDPKYSAFTDEELSPIVEKIRLELVSTPQQ